MCPGAVREASVLMMLAARLSVFYLDIYSSQAQQPEVSQVTVQLEGEMSHAQDGATTPPGLYEESEAMQLEPEFHDHLVTTAFWDRHTISVVHTLFSVTWEFSVSLHLWGKILLWYELPYLVDVL